MGMYTELIFGAELRADTPKNVIETLRYMLGEIDKPNDIAFETKSSFLLFRGASYYFGVSRSCSMLEKDEITGCWIISTRANLKNYDNDIESFLEWIKPYVNSGSGWNDMYAIVIYEESLEPIIYYLNEEQ
jgi:hypothetical protein